MRPLIGLTGPSSFTQECIDMLEEFYEADLMMLYHNNTENLIRWVDRCDGVCMAGGVDIHPSVYDHSIWNNQGFGKFDLKRDIRELKIIEHCHKMKKPLFGICRGHQLIGIMQGFFLIPDLAGSSVCHSPQKQQISLDRNEPTHAVILTDADEYYSVFNGRDPQERIWFKRIMGHDTNAKLYTNSFHHQGLAYPTNKKQWPAGSQDTNVYGIARVDLQHIKIDKIIELMGGDYWVSCQWHPEFDWKVNTASMAMIERFKTLLGKGMPKKVVVEL